MATLTGFDHFKSNRIRNVTVRSPDRKSLSDALARFEIIETGLVFFLTL